MKYRKKPVVVEAFKYDGDLMGINGKYYIPDWAVNAYVDGIMYFGSHPKHDHETSELFIRTLEGDHHVSVGDYIIQGVQGELYPCKPDIFERTYEEMTDKLKPCPSCGGKAKFHTKSNKSNSYSAVFEFDIVCRKCGMKIPYTFYMECKMCDDGLIRVLEDDKDRAISLWNSRNQDAKGGPE